MIDGPFERPFLAAGDAGADEEEPLRLQVPGAAGRVGVVGVAAVDQDVARLEQRDQLVDHVVDRRPGLDHDHDLARRLQGGDQLLDRVGADDLLPLGPARRRTRRPCDVVRLKTATVKPWLSMFRTRFSPITARPIRPMSAVFAVVAMIAVLSALVVDHDWPRLRA